MKMTLSTIFETQKLNILTVKHASRRAGSTSDFSPFQNNPFLFLAKAGDGGCSNGWNVSVPDATSASETWLKDVVRCVNYSFSSSMYVSVLPKLTDCHGLNELDERLFQNERSAEGRG